MARKATRSSACARRANCGNSSAANMILSKLKPMINAAHAAFNFARCAAEGLDAFASRSDQRRHLAVLLEQLLGHAATAPPMPEQLIGAAAEVHAPGSASRPALKETPGRPEFP